MSIKDYAVNTIQWQSKTNGTYGPSYATAVTVEKVYIEPNISIIRGADNETVSDSAFILFEDTAFLQGDKVTMNSRGYTITSVSRFLKPRSTVLDHIEVSLKEVNSG